MNRGYVRNIIPFSSVDGPGNRTVIFLQGCNFDCLYCHNPETIPLVNSDKYDQKAKNMTVKDVIDQIEPYNNYTRGVTISGGECTVQKEFLLALVRKLKAKDYEVYLDTNGNIPFDYLMKLVDFVDKFMIDIKSWSLEEHQLMTGVSNLKVKETINYLVKQNKIYELRTVIIPQKFDNIKTVTKVIDFIVTHDKTIRYKLIKYRQHGVRENKLIAMQPGDDFMEQFIKIAQEKGYENIIII